MQDGKQAHILNASCNLIGIAFIIMTGIRITSKTANSLADEVCLTAALVFLGSSLFSYMSLRKGSSGDFYERIADYLLILGIIALFAGVMAFAYDLF
jgi:hypothetical protein